MMMNFEPCTPILISSILWSSSSSSSCVPPSPPSEGLTSNHLAAAGSLVPEVRHAPHPCGLLLPLHPTLHILWHRLQVAHPGSVRYRRGQAHCAPKRVDPDPGPKVDKGHAHGPLVVPLAGESLSLLLLLQLLQRLQENGAEKAGNLLHFGLVGLHDLPKPWQHKDRYI